MFHKACSRSLTDQPKPTQGGGTGRSLASPGALTWGSLDWNGQNQLHFALTVQSASRKAVAETRASESRDTHEQDKTRSKAINKNEQRFNEKPAEPPCNEKRPSSGKACLVVDSRKLKVHYYFPMPCSLTLRTRVFIYKVKGKSNTKRRQTQGKPHQTPATTNNTPPTHKTHEHSH